MIVRVRSESYANDGFQASLKSWRTELDLDMVFWDWLSLLVHQRQRRVLRIVFEEPVSQEVRFERDD